MTHEELLEEIQIELRLMETVVQDVVALSKSTIDREITN